MNLGYLPELVVEVGALSDAVADGVSSVQVSVVVGYPVAGGESELSLELEVTPPLSVAEDETVIGVVGVVFDVELGEVSYGGLEELVDKPPEAAVDDGAAPDV